MSRADNGAIVARGGGVGGRGGGGWGGILKVFWGRGGGEGGFASTYQWVPEAGVVVDGMCE